MVHRKSVRVHWNACNLPKRNKFCGQRESHDRKWEKNGVHNCVQSTWDKNIVKHSIHAMLMRWSQSCEQLNFNAAERSVLDQSFCVFSNAFQLLNSSSLSKPRAISYSFTLSWYIFFRSFYCVCMEINWLKWENVVSDRKRCLALYCMFLFSSRCITTRQVFSLCKTTENMIYTSF